MPESRSLSTRRLLLPPLTRDHTEDLTAIYGDPEVARYVGGDRLTDETISLQVAAFADEWAENDYGQSAVILRESGEFVGRIGLHYWPQWDEIELGYILARSVQGTGVAAEGAQVWLAWAKSTATIDYVIANIHPENAASIGLAKKLQFKLSRHDVTPSGQPTLIYRLNT